MIYPPCHTPLLRIDNICKLRGSTGGPCRSDLIYAKYEGVQPSGSMKYRSAMEMMRQCPFKRGEKGTVIESSSGNMGAALSLICKEWGWTCIIVADPKLSPFHRQAIYDNDGIIWDVSLKDDTGGYLKTRLAVVQNALAENPTWHWPNQYESRLNTMAFKRMATEIIEDLLVWDQFRVNRRLWLFGAVSTGGSLSGCADQLKTIGLHTSVVAVDAVGSAIFGQYPRTRHLNGIGSSLSDLPLLERDLIDYKVYVSDVDAFSFCYRLKEGGVNAGGSSGAVMWAIREMSPLFLEEDVVVGIFPDHSMIYKDTIYNKEWLAEREIEIYEVR